MPQNNHNDSKRLLMVLLIPIIVFGLGTVVWLLWNWLMPDIFGLKEITFWQALGLFVLSKLLLGGFGRHKGAHRKSNDKDVSGKTGESWMKMTDEEKQAFKEKWKKRWHNKPENPEDN